MFNGKTNYLKLIMKGGPIQTLHFTLSYLTNTLITNLINQL